MNWIGGARARVRQENAGGFGLCPQPNRQGNK
jgi:hypothetical protein